MLNDQRNPLVFFILILAITAADSEREREKKSKAYFLALTSPGKCTMKGNSSLTLILTRKAAL